MWVLPDILKRGLRLVFVGEAVGKKSALAGHYYADPGNVFWCHLHLSGLTPVCLTPERDTELLRYGIGLTDIVKHLTNGEPKDIAVSKGDWETWVGEAQKRVQAVAPRVVCFNGIKVARRVLKLKACSPSRQSCPWADAETWVIDSSSARAVRWQPRRLQCLRCLAQYLDKG